MKHSAGRREFPRISTKLAGGAMLLPTKSFAQASGLVTHQTVGAGARSDDSDAITQADLVWTVAGQLPASALGFTLAHEHVMVDFVGAAEVSPSRYKVQDV
ncbi:MAG: hypothetical protein EOP49_46775, partial [Sphingobacteriales bacterium]